MEKDLCLSGRKARKGWRDVPIVVMTDFSSASSSCCSAFSVSVDSARSMSAASAEASCLRSSRSAASCCFVVASSDSSFSSRPVTIVANAWNSCSRFAKVR